MDRGLITLQLSGEKSQYLETSMETAAEAGNVVKPQQGPTKKEKSEIHSSVFDKEKMSQDLRAKIESEYKIKYDDLMNSAEKKHSELDAAAKMLNELLNAMQKEFDGFVKLKYWDRESIVVSLVIEALSKILGYKGVNEEYIKTVVAEHVHRYSEHETFRIKVSVRVCAYISELLEDKILLKKVFLEDSRLNDGQLVFESHSCVKEIGLVDRFEAIKRVLVDELRKNGPVSEL